METSKAWSCQDAASVRIRVRTAAVTMAISEYSLSMVRSAGFWPGGGMVEYPAFYSYAYPASEGFAEARFEPEDARFERELGEFLLPCDAVRRAVDPEATLMAFLESTYRAAADLGGWDRGRLECALGEPRQSRSL